MFINIINKYMKSKILSDNIEEFIPIAHAESTYINEDNAEGKSKTVAEKLVEITTEIDKKANNANVQLTNFITWDNDNVRFYGERGSVYNQGFSEFYGFPSTQVEMEVDGVLQSVVCLPNENIVSGNFNTVSGLVRKFTLDDYNNLKLYGGNLSGQSMLGTENPLNGISGVMSVAIEKVENFRTVERISFKGHCKVTNNESYLMLVQIDPGSILLNDVSTTIIPFDGTIEGLPIIKIGEWFSWSIKIPAGYDLTTKMDFYINDILVEPIKFIARPLSTTTPTNDCVAKLSSWPTSTYSPLGSGCYSYHTNYGITIMKEATEKELTNDILSNSGLLYIITPEGNIDISLHISDEILPLPVGHQISIIATNTPGSIKIYGNPTFLVNGLRNTNIYVWRNMILDGLNIANNGANYYMDILTPVIL